MSILIFTDMPIFKKWEYNGAACGIWKVTETAGEFRSLLTERSVSDDFSEYKSASRQLEYLAVRVLLLDMLGRECRILHYDSGKPYLQDYEAKISISHTKGYVAVIIHPHKEVGIDIEYHSDRVKKVVSRFIGVEEMSLIEEKLRSVGCEEERDRLMLNLYLLFWSAKETMFKMMDASEVDFISHLHVNSVSLSDSPVSYTSFDGSMSASESRTAKAMKIDVEFRVSEDFVCTYSCLD